VPPEEVGQTRISFSRERLHHIQKVLRLRAGDLLTVTDGTGVEYSVRLGADGPRKVTAEIIRTRRRSVESPLKTVLAQAVPRGDRMSLIVQKAVELGVTEIWPLLTARTVVSVTGERARLRRERWQKVIQGAVGQSGRTRVPGISMVRSWSECLAERPEADLKLLLWERERRELGELLRDCPPPKSVLLTVGPEGGWSEEEVRCARGAGFLTARMGPRVMRTETVGLVALGILQFRYGDLVG
jgi:16S rRNA (uracil1498-N3)-methyltransferase